MAVYSYGIPQDTAAANRRRLAGHFPNKHLHRREQISVTPSRLTRPRFWCCPLSRQPAPAQQPQPRSQNPALAGSGVTFTATVSGSGGTPTGFVVFNDGTTNLGIGTLNSSGMANLTTAALSVGGSPHSITAVYSGDGAFAGSTSSALSQDVTNKTSVSTNGLSASWPFNEGSGTNAADSSGNGNTGTLYDSPVWVSGLNGSNALEFPGAVCAGQRRMCLCPTAPHWPTRELAATSPSAPG